MQVELLPCSRSRDHLCGEVAGGSHEARRPIRHSRMCARQRVSRSGANYQRSFEEGAFGGGSVREVPRGDTALSGWTVIENPIAWYTNGYEPNPLKPIGVGPHSGNLAVNLCDGSVANLCDGSVRPVSISQTFTVLPFVEQQLTFWVGNYGGNGGPVSIKVTITDGTSNTLLLSETAMAPASNLDSTWQEFTYSYTSQIPDGTSNTIVLSEIGGGGYYAGLDDMSVAAVPEPST
jgi:hypothetical protein